ncbi:hypothetical protein BMF94_3980 [Rhodotorula taiwanensis]|uniref:Zn(2)-C6 fungal-type domain-containing protein n=1 Tax=Rhodotorula taiwanensis TaxID=741276 RepID=A0A2S5B885_9BASI|nr:hypothetical protein BMF94_3980 [Rhodotorula taiwanensis]
MPRDLATDSSPLAIRDPVSLACETCRLRKVRCERPPGFESDSNTACKACMRKGVQCVYVDRPKTRNRSGRILEEARARYGTVPPAAVAPSSDLALLRPVVPAQDSLVQQELASSIGSRLLAHWLGAAQTRTYLPDENSPLVLFIALIERYDALDRRLDRLAPADQLLCRSIYAAAAPAYLPSHWPGDKRRAIVKQLCRDAERLADGLAIWRKADLTHIAPLLTLYKIHNTDDANAEEALPYLSAAIAQCRQLDRRSAAGRALVTPGTGAWISWTLIMMDVFGAVERAQPPHLSRDEVLRFFGTNGPVLRDPSSVPGLDTLDEGDRLSKRIALGAFSTLLLLAHDAATITATSDCSRYVLEGLWAQLESLYRWCRSAVVLSRTAGSSSDRLYWYGIVIWSTCTAIELSLVTFIGLNLARSARTLAGDDATVSRRFDELVGLSAIAQRRVETQLCSYIPHTFRDTDRDWLNTLAFIPGITASISRILDLAQTLARTSVPDPALFPRGAIDRLRMLDYVKSQIRNLGEAYPSTKLRQTIDMLHGEQRRMQDMLATGDLGLGRSVSSSFPHAQMGSLAAHNWRASQPSFEPIAFSPEESHSTQWQAQ